MNDVEQSVRNSKEYYGDNMHRLTGRIFEGDEITWRSKEVLQEIKIGYCKDCGFYHADPYPSEEFLKDYYQSYEIPCPLYIEERFRIARLLLSYLKEDSSIVDIGCGKGEMLEVLHKCGFKNLYGTEFGVLRNQSKRISPITILPYDVNGFCDWCKKEAKRFDCTILINVLEHVPEPVYLLRRIKDIITTDGMLMFVVPNDFNVLQQVYLEKNKTKPWFLILPDHVNFFTINDIDNVVERAGYQVIRKTVQFPLEFFLLQGDDYVAAPKTGKKCHKKRVAFEKAFLEVGKLKELEELYSGFAKMAIGRVMYVFAKPASSK
ncbi:MAG TPA: class I SAM-dependent methyltransferase [Syntrophorhabdaceae bacterium]|nr:class I SAM-dependent methyltransferase [Syntrophorhabdaceae bacterium]HQM80958.1 class I SAM-dependent methyltransferase [Syntrophorhabdaceae bacterium]